VAAAPLALDVQAVAALMSAVAALVSAVAALTSVAVAALLTSVAALVMAAEAALVMGCGWGGVWLGVACLGSVACTGSCWQWDRYLRRWINVCY
jgi:hypothetical protein